MLNFGLALAHRCAQNCPVCWQLIEMATLMTLQVGASQETSRTLSFSILTTIFQVDLG